LAIQPRDVLRFILRGSRRVGITIAGFALIVVGAIMLITPGPGWAAIFAGLALLSLEYAWAERLLVRVKAKVTAAARKVRRRRNDHPEPPDPATTPDQDRAEA
jgi:uncharacterized protein (TIGR02611 family)